MKLVFQNGVPYLPPFLYLYTLGRSNEPFRSCISSICEIGTGGENNVASKTYGIWRC